VEFSARHYGGVTPVDDVLVRTNHYVTEAMKRFEVAPHPWKRNSQARFLRIQRLLEERRGDLTPTDALQILRDCVDPFEDRKRVTGNVVAGLNTTQSFVMSPDEDTLWIARGDHPVSHNDPYVGFRISALLAADSGNYACEGLSGRSQLDTSERSALAQYVEAWTEHFDHFSVDQALFRLRQARQHLPEEPIFPRMMGLLLMKQRRYQQALPHLIESAQFEYRDVLVRCESILWVGRCLDLMGRRDESKEQYQQAKALGVPLLSEAARRHLEKPFKRWELLDVSPEFIVGTAIAKYRRPRIAPGPHPEPSSRP